MGEWLSQVPVKLDAKMVARIDEDVTRFLPFLSGALGVDSRFAGSGIQPNRQRQCGLDAGRIAKGTGCTASAGIACTKCTERRAAMTGPEKLAEHSKWLEAHPWWASGLTLLLVLLMAVVSQLIVYACLHAR
jgi:hypothetical protein